MHLLFASLAPWYPGTSRDGSHIGSLEADESPTNICWLPRRAGHLRRRVTNKVPALIPYHGTSLMRSQLKFLAQMITIKPWQQPRSCSGQQGHQHKQVPRTITTSALLLQGYPGARDTNDRCISLVWHWPDSWRRVTVKKFVGKWGRWTKLSGQYQSNYGSV